MLADKSRHELYGAMLRLTGILFKGSTCNEALGRERYQEIHQWINRQVCFLQLDSQLF